jgi:hypothetical protein
MEDRLQEATKIAKQYEETSELLNAESMIKDNKIEFFIEDKKYRVRLLNLAERNELDNLRRKKFGQLIQDKDILMEKDLIKQYKERGIDLVDLDDQINKLNAQEFDLQIKLGEAISKNNGEVILNTYKENIDELQQKKNTITAQKSLLLEYSLENQLLSYVYQVFTYLSLEEFVNETWKRKFNTFVEFEKSLEDKIVTTAAQYSILLQML